ncbi:hypothetical protein XPU_3337 [Xanthomonas arboricola pv. pruni str. MAFF 311562]|uniref:Uncharacterized protein n=1 Tax=Xanthomonas arboricola pv. pruni str. MAFF 311562 TaxID=1414836 RepID=W4S5A7_9XANT|nr:hypothetical protein XPU_3337 [Xanthomonas arboricola pv. pruni str. MAFF 311562]
MRSDNGTTHGLLMPDNSENTNFTTTQVSQTGSRVSKPVRKTRCREGRVGGVGDSDIRAL